MPQVGGSVLAEEKATPLWNRSAMRFSASAGSMPVLAANSEAWPGMASIRSASRSSASMAKSPAMRSECPNWMLAASLR